MARTLGGIPSRRRLGEDPTPPIHDLEPDQPFNPFSVPSTPDIIEDPWYNAVPAIPRNYPAMRYPPIQVSAEPPVPSPSPEARRGLRGPYDFPPSPADDPGFRYREERERDYGVFPAEEPEPYGGRPVGGLIRGIGAALSPEARQSALAQAEAVTGFPISKVTELVEPEWVKAARAGEQFDIREHPLAALDLLTAAPGPAGAAGALAGILRRVDIEKLPASQRALYEALVAQRPAKAADPIEGWVTDWGPKPTPDPRSFNPVAQEQEAGAILATAAAEGIPPPSRAGVPGGAGPGGPVAGAGGIPVIPPGNALPSPPPPGPAGGGGGTPPSHLPRYTHPMVEAEAVKMEAGGISQYIVNDMRAAYAAVNAAPAAGLRRIASVVKMADPAWRNYALRDAPKLDALWQSTVAHANAQASLVRNQVWEMRATMEDVASFGRDALSGKPVMPHAYRGPAASPALQPYIGTLRDMLERPDLYNLNPLQRRTADLWQRITDESLKVAQKMGLTVGEVEGRWVGHAFKLPDDPAQAQMILNRITAALQSSGKRGFQRARGMELEDFAELGQKLGLEIDTDVLGILNKRLTGMAEDWNTVAWLDQVAATTGGKRAGLGPPISAKTHLGEGLVQHRGMTWHLPSDTANVVNEWLGRHYLPPGDREIANAALLLRSPLNFDASAGIGLQGARAFFSNPIGTVKDWATGARLRLTPEGMAEFYHNNSDRLIWWAERGLTFKGPVDLPHASLGQKPVGFEALPAVGGPLKAFNEWQWGQLVPMFKLRAADDYLAMLKSMRDGTGAHRLFGKLPVIRSVTTRLGGLAGKSDDDLGRAVAAVIDNRFGGGTVKGAPTAPAWDILFWTQNWLRANVGFMAQAVSLGTPEGVLARHLLAREYAYKTLLSAGSLALAGKGISELELDPRSYLWGDITTPFGRVALGGQSILGILSRIIFGSKPGEYGSDLGPVEQRVKALGSFAQAKLGAGVVVPVQVGVTGEDFYGQQIENHYRLPGLPDELQGFASRLNYSAQRLALPIAAQQGAEDVIQQVPPEQAIPRLAVQALGANVKDFTVAQRFNDMAKVQYNKKWSTLSSYQRNRLEFTPEGRTIRDQQKMRDEQRALYEMRRKAYDDQSARDELFRKGEMTPDAWRREVYQQQAYRAGASDAWQIATGRKHPAPKNDDERALKEYYELLEKFSKAPVFDTFGFKEARVVLRETWNESQRAYVDENRHASDTPQVRNYFLRALPVYDQYNDLRRKDVGALLGVPEVPPDVWRRYSTFAGKLSEQPDKFAKAALLDKLGEEAFQFVAWDKSVKKLGTLKDAPSQRFRRAHPEMAAYGLVAAVSP